MSEQPNEEHLKAAAEAYLRANGVEGITISGGGDNWFVSVGFAEHERFVTAYSGRNPATPNDPMYLAQKALETLVRNERPQTPEPLALQSEEGETLEHESDGETGATVADEALSGFGGGAESDASALWSPSDEPEPMVGEPSVPIDAEFTVEDLGAEILDEGQDLPALEGAELQEPEAQTDGPIAYGASTIDGLIREKLGRVSQIARELKSALQEGWTVEEYAYLQNLMVRMDRGEAPDDQGARERFLAIASKSQAMSRIDAIRDRKEGELEDIGQRRDFDAAVYYEPGEGWP